MKKFLYFLFISISFTSFAQESQKTTIGEFKEIKVYDRIEVELIKADENKVVVSGKNKEDVVIVHKKDILKIRMTLQEAFNGDETTVQVYYTSLEVVDANEGTFIGSNDVLEQFDLTVKAQEGGTVTLQVKDLNYLDVKSVSGGTISISGSSKNQTVDINTGGTYKAKDLLTENTTVTIHAAGSATIHATKKVEAKVRAGGSVYIYGNPETVDENTILGGKIIIKE